MKKIKLIECPRDAMQGWANWIPTDRKIAYLNQLLKVGFDTLDFGSFVSPKAIPQMADTIAVYDGLDLDNTYTKLLAIVANLRGAETAVDFEKIQYLGFPFSISETFQLRNTNISISEAFKTVESIQNLCLKTKKELVVYFSMGFGNPYGDPYNIDVVSEWAEKMSNLGIKIISLSDTVGLAENSTISTLFEHLICAYSNIEFGGHFHATSDNWQTKIHTAFEAGCDRFDGAIGGFGGCPMAEDELVGNIDTQNLVSYFSDYDTNLNNTAFQKSVILSREIFI
ncbi:MAG: hydroxymethylglutaryl-CoA lyase [Bacteroidota bacterium]|jgi:hydroxymethylglutaryl-CoA lyase